ncbi:hypothetical protein GCM10010420_39600 [Streptomyces glaucosporus]|uniref:Uncharacterized protein n=1 Tax=Streptomyces glaucosporus TaxID=284044 RepID=A0ABN3ILF7_9ACTN
MKPTDAALAEITAEFCDSEPEHRDSGDLSFLVKTARRHGLLEGVTVHELTPEACGDEAFLITVEIADRITVSSSPLLWREMALGADDFVRRLLERIAQVADRLRADFAAEAVLRSALERAARHPE